MESYDSMVESSLAEHGNVTYTCVIVDMTDASNTCKRHVITLSGTYTIEDLIEEAAKFYAYDASSFNLVYKEANTPLNDPMIRQFRLLDMGLDEDRRNVFEIHEKEGPPKRLKGTDENLVATSCDSDLVEDNGSFFGDGSLTAPVGYGSRRHAMGSVLTVPVVSPANGGFYYTSAAADASSGVSHGSQVEFGPVNMPVLNFDDNNSDYVGLINQAMTCYLNSLLQTLFMTPEFRNGIYRWNCPEEITQEEAKKSIPFQLQRLFLNLQTSNKKSIHTQDLTKSFGWNSDDAFQQHDVQELCRVMFDALEKKFKGTKQENLINELYQGKIKDYVKCLECNTESARVDVFLDIPLCIRPFGSDKTYESVEAALDAFVQPEILDENNKYFCDKCNRMCKAHKGLKFESFPYIISLQLKRFDFDYKTLSRFKLSNTVSFPHILNVKKYLQAEDENKEDGVESVAPTMNEPGAETPIDEHNGTDDANKTAVSSSQQQNCPHDYELFSIMIHSGSATGGHYYAYIKCFETNQWFNFNDERVSKIDKDDIIKAFGHSYSTYSSTTAYMLLYRQVNAKRNEQFIKIDEFDEHLKKLLEKEKNEQIEADRLKEYMENVCKIKTFVNTASMDDLFEASSLSDGVMLVGEATNKQPPKRMERVLEIHKDFTIAKAREHILKEFNMEEYLRRTGKKMRILKYDSYNDLVEQSYPNEDTLTVFEAIGFTKCPYNVSWQLEFTPEHEPFVEYYSSDFNVKVCNLNIITFEVNDLFSLRLNSKATINELREKIAQKLNCEPEKVRMALERLHTLNNYTYLNNNLDQTLKGLNFTRVNKVFIEHEDTADLTSSKTFENSKFFYALDTIINMFNMIVYLPNEEQCDMFVKKTQRHQLYLKAHLDSSAAKSATSPSSSIQPPPPPPQPSAPATDENTQDAYDIASVQSGAAAAAAAESPKKSASKSIVETPSNDVDDSASKMSFQETSSHMSSLAFGAKSAMPLIEDHFKTNKPTTVNRGKLVELNLNDMETSLDEGIGSSGSLSNNNLKNSPNSFDNSKLSPICNMDESSPINNDNDNNNTTATLSTNVNEGKTKWYDEGFNMKSTGLIGNGSSSLSNDDDEGENLADEADLDVNVDDNEVNNIDDDFNDTNNQPLNNCDDLTDDKDDDIKRKLMELDEDRLSSYRSSYFDHDQNEPQHAGQMLETNNDSKNNHHNDDDDDDDSDKLPKYSELKHSAGYQMNKNEIFHDLFNSGANNSSSNVMTGDAYDVNGPVSATDSDTHRDTDNYDHFKTTQSANDAENAINGSNPFSRLHEVRYIKSNLIVNAELGTRTLEIKMDRRIDLMEFKSHIDDYLHIGLVNFRVFRMCPSDVECELTASENQFLYLAQNTKFVIKLGPPLKYGEYVLPVYRLNKSKGTFLYCCDFMIFFRLSVYNHKEMLIDDLKDECNLDISIDKMRLRKKNGKKPGAILLDSEVFGTDIFVNAMTELCIEILDETEKKTSKNQTSVYVRHWKPDEYELGELREEIVEGNSYEQLINHISSISGIPIGDIEVLKCKRDYPFKSPIMDLHRDAAWKDNYFLVMEKLEDGCCFYYRNKTLKLGPISEEKKKEMEKEDNLNFRPLNSIASRKETGIKIHVESS